MKSLKNNVMKGARRLILLFPFIFSVDLFEFSDAFSVSGNYQQSSPSASSSTFHVHAAAIRIPSTRLKKTLCRSSPTLETEDFNNGPEPNSEQKNLQQTASVFLEMALPYYKESKAGRWLFAGMIGMTLLNSGVSVAFSYVGKDFWNALSSKGK